MSVLGNSIIPVLHCLCCVITRWVTMGQDESAALPYGTAQTCLGKQRMENIRCLAYN
jgi:hypothetical protein